MEFSGFRTARPAGINNPLMPIVVLWAVVLVGLITFVWIENDWSRTIKGFYLLPWTLLAGVCVLAPSAYLLYKGKFDFFHPLVFAAWSYVFPAMIGGGVFVSLGLVDPYFLTFIEQPDYNLPLSLVYVGVGFLAMAVGFALPIGRLIANRFEGSLPKWKWEPSELFIPGLLVFMAGLAVNLVGLVQGIMGYQRLTDVGIFDSVLFYLLTLLSVGYVMIWLGIFGSRFRTGLFYIMIALAVLFIPIRAAIIGSRGSILLSIFPIAFAFQYSGRRLKPRYAVIFGTLLVVAGLLGIVYGTAFRQIKGSESKIGVGDYFGVVVDTVDYIANEDPTKLAQNSLQALADRVDNLTSLGVVVANYEQLAPYEESYRIHNNIINDALTSFVPRFAWPDKPPTSDARAYSELYFNFGDNSFAITPFGDLLRNFGPIGVPLGMLVLGIYLRLIYAGLIDTASPALWKKAAYYPLLTVVSYESFYAVILPGVIRVGFVLLVSLAVANLLIRMIRGSFDSRMAGNGGIEPAV
jgi:hypothetical protein